MIETTKLVDRMIKKGMRFRKHLMFGQYDMIFHTKVLSTQLKSIQIVLCVSHLYLSFKKGGLTNKTY